jgi:prolyl-tRNA synthetase
VHNEAEAIYRRLNEEGFDVLFDDRDARAGEKFSDSDLVGVPFRLTISKRTFAEGKLEPKRRTGAQSELATLDQALVALRQRGNRSADRP